MQIRLEQYWFDLFAFLFNSVLEYRLDVQRRHLHNLRIVVPDIQGKICFARLTLFLFECAVALPRILVAIHRLAVEWDQCQSLSQELVM